MNELDRAAKMQEAMNAMAEACTDMDVVDCAEHCPFRFFCEKLLDAELAEYNFTEGRYSPLNWGTKK